MSDNYSDFYKDKFFNIIKDDIGRMEVKLNILQEGMNEIKLAIQKNNNDNDDKINKIDGKVNRIYWFVGGIAFAISFAIDWIKSKFL